MSWCRRRILPDFTWYEAFSRDGCGRAENDEEGSSILFVVVDSGKLVVEFACLR